MHCDGLGGWSVVGRLRHGVEVRAHEALAQLRRDIECAAGALQSDPDALRLLPLLQVDRMRLLHRRGRRARKARDPQELRVHSGTSIHIPIFAFTALPYLLFSVF